MVDLSEKSLLKCSLEAKLSKLNAFNVSGIIIYSNSTPIQIGQQAYPLIITTPLMLDKMLTTSFQFALVMINSLPSHSASLTRSETQTEDKGLFIVIIIVSSIAALSILVVIYYMCVR
jgi:hypothetical protein